MAIKIIKHGEKKKFTKTCPDCGCEFEFETEDLKTDYEFCLTSYPGQYRRYVLCPECGKKLYHDTISIDPQPPHIIYTGQTTRTLDCETCPNRPDPDHPVVGDTPCSLCPKMTPTCK